MGDHVAKATTQQRFPRRAVARTVVQNILGWIIGAGVVIPTAVAIVHEELAQFLPEQVLGVLATTGAVSAAAAGAAAKIMAIPRVDRWLARVHLSSAPHL